MLNYTISAARKEAWHTQMTHRMEEVLQELGEWATAEPRTLEALEQRTLETVKGLGQEWLEGLSDLSVPAYPETHVACPCGDQAAYQRRRPAQVKTLLGPITVTRPYYLCATCHHGFAPLDQQMGLCAGGLSASLEEVVALLGAQGPFGEAVDLLGKLTLVEVCPNTCKAVTERLGQTIAQQDAQVVAAAWSPAASLLPAPAEPAPARLYVSMDGFLVHTREEGWKEMKLGAFYTTRPVPTANRPEGFEVRAQAFSFYADFAEPEAFGRALWWEGVRRGALQAQEIIALGDGAHWIWNLVAEHFPEAIQILDWPHAAGYLWEAAHTIFGEGTDLAKRWAKDRLEELWAGQVEAVEAHLQAHVGAGEAVQQALTYYANNRERMRYADYRARGLQIGSGSIESGVKHVLGARLKQAGMRWHVEGARAVAKVRARLKSGRWEETMAQRPPPQRTYERKAA